MALTGESERSTFPLAILAASGIVLLLAGGMFLLSREGPAAPSSSPTALPFGDAEQAYAAQIRFSGPQMSRAANMLNQEVTFVLGTVENAGPRSVREIEVSAEFQDLIKQVILREEHLHLLRGAPLRPGEKREFQLNFEKIPNDWNRQYPVLRVTGLQFE